MAWGKHNTKFFFLFFSPLCTLWWGKKSANDSVFCIASIRLSLNWMCQSFLLFFFISRAPYFVQTQSTKRNEANTTARVEHQQQKQAWKQWFAMKCVQQTIEWRQGKLDSAKDIPFNFICFGSDPPEAAKDKEEDEHTEASSNWNYWLNCIRNSIFDLRSVISVSSIRRSLPHSPIDGSVNDWFILSTIHSSCDWKKSMYKSIDGKMKWQLFSCHGNRHADMIF